MKYKSINVSIHEQQTGHIYIVDVKALGKARGWLLSAILLHQQSFIGNELKYPQVTSAARFKIKSLRLQQQILSIQQALIDGKRVHAEVLFHDLKLSKQASQEDIVNTEAELLAFNHVVVEYRSGGGY